MVFLDGFPFWRLVALKYPPSLVQRQIMCE